MSQVHGGRNLSAWVPESEEQKLSPHQQSETLISVDVCSFASVVSVTPWNAAHQALPSLRFSRQEYWVGCHFLLQRWNPHLSCLLHWQLDSLPTETKTDKIVKPEAWCYLSTEHNPDKHPSLSPQLQHLLSVHPQSTKDWRHTSSH